MATSKPKSKDSFKDRLTRLETIVQWFEGDAVDIDQAIERYEQGLSLIKSMETDLKTAKNKVSKIKLAS